MGLRKLFVLSGAALILLGAWQLSRHWPKAVEPPRPELTEKERRAEFARQDRETLAPGAHRTDAEIADALMRLSRQEDPLAREEALRRRSDPGPRIRQGAATALGAYSDPGALEALVALARDPDRETRLRAIAALGSRRQAERESALKEIQARPGLGADEREALVAALLNASVQPAAQGKGVEELIRLAQSPGAGQARARSVLDAIGIAPKDPRVLALLREILVKEFLPEAAPAAIRHLALSRDPWLRSSAARLVESKDPDSRIALIQTLHVSCPSDRWPILENVFERERDRGVLIAAISELQQLPGKDARALLEKLVAGRLTGTELNLAKQALSVVKASSLPNPCL